MVHLRLAQRICHRTRQSRSGWYARMIRSWNPHTKIDPSGTNRAQYAREGSSSITVGLRLGRKREPRRTRSDATTFPPPRRRPRSRARRISPTGASGDADEGAGTARRRSSGTGTAPLRRRKSATISLSRMGFGARRVETRTGGAGRVRGCRLSGRAREGRARPWSGGAPEPPRRGGRRRGAGTQGVVQHHRHRRRRRCARIGRGARRARSEPASAAVASSPSFPSGATRPSTVSSSTASSSPPRRRRTRRPAIVRTK